MKKSLFMLVYLFLFLSLVTVSAVTIPNYICGDGVVNGDEECDGNADAFFCPAGGGEAVCTDSCKLDYGNCCPASLVLTTTTVEKEYSFIPLVSKTISFVLSTLSVETTEEVSSCDYKECTDKKAKECNLECQGCSNGVCVDNGFFKEKCGDFCCRKENPVENCVGIPKLGDFCKEECESPLVRCGSATCCDSSTESSPQTCSEITIYRLWGKLPVGSVGYCVNKTCSEGQTAYNDKCQVVTDGSHYMCCSENYECGFREDDGNDGAFFPSCVAKKCDKEKGLAICNGFPDRILPNPELPSTPTGPDGKDLKGELSICCPIGTCIVSKGGYPYCNTKDRGY